MTRASGDLTDDGFIAGQLLGIGIGSDEVQYRIVSIDGRSMTLKGAALQNATNVQKVFWVQGAHGGLTVVHGGGNLPIETTGNFTWANQTCGTGNSTLTRLDGSGWPVDGYKVGARCWSCGAARRRPARWTDFRSTSPAR